MARKDDIETSGAAPVLKGLAGELAAAVRDRAETFLAGAVDPQAVDRDLRTITQFARAAVAVQAMQAAEDKADARAVDAASKRAAARVQALTPNSDEGDETDMHERDPRLDTAEGVAEIYEDARRSVDSVFRRLEIKRGDQRAGDAGDSVGVVEKLDCQSERSPTPPH